MKRWSIAIVHMKCCNKKSVIGLSKSRRKLKLHSKPNSEEALAKQQAKEQERLAREQQKADEKAQRDRDKLTQDVLGTFAKSAARTLGGPTGQKLVRGLLGSLFGKR